MNIIQAAQDRWQSLEDEPGAPDPTPGREHLLLTLPQWQAVRDEWPAGRATGLRLDNRADVEALADDLPRFALIVLEFPAWTDGRAYSQAHLLRSRLGFDGELRATGEVLVDMLPLLQRCGFDAVAMRADQDRRAAERALGFFPGHYQRAARQRGQAIADRAARP